MCDRNSSERPRVIISRTCAPVSVAVARFPGELVASQTCRGSPGPRAGPPGRAWRSAHRGRPAPGRGAPRGAAGRPGSRAGRRGPAGRARPTGSESQSARSRSHAASSSTTAGSRGASSATSSTVRSTTRAPVSSTSIMIRPRCSPFQPAWAMGSPSCGPGAQQVVGVPADDDVDQPAHRPADAAVVVDPRVAEDHHDVGPVASSAVASCRTAVTRPRSVRPRSSYCG